MMLRALCGIIAAALLCACSQDVPVAQVTRPVRAVKVADTAALTGRVLPGRARATQEVNLAFRVSGPLITRPINVGDFVEAGAILAQIDPRDFKVNLRTVEAQLEEARAAAGLALEELERVQVAYDRNAVSEIELVRRRQARDKTAAQVTALEASVEAAGDALDDTTLTAPFEGTITAIYVENFEDVIAKQAILRLLDTTSIEMIVDVPEQYISLAPFVVDVHCTFDTFPDRPIPAAIKEIGTEASNVTRTYPITLSMEQPEDFKVLPGMTGSARGRVDHPEAPHADGYELPTSAVLEASDGTTAVWVIDESTGTVARRDVEVLGTTSRGLRVSGVEPGEWVATAGAHYLEEGQNVRLLDAPEPAT